MGAAEFITLSCPSCGGKLQITTDVERFACSHCGNEHVVKRGGGIVSLAPVMEGLQKVQASTDRVGAELAIQRLTTELEQSTEKVKAARTKYLAADAKSGSVLIGVLAVLSFLAAGFFFIILAIGFFRAAPNERIYGLIFAAFDLVPILFGVLFAALFRNEANANSRAAAVAQAELRAAEKVDETIRGELARQRQLAK